MASQAIALRNERPEQRRATLSTLRASHSSGSTRLHARPGRSYELEAEDPCAVRRDGMRRPARRRRRSAGRRRHESCRPVGGEKTLRPRPPRAARHRSEGREGEWHAAVAGGRSTIVRAAGDSMSFALPGGSFTGRLDARRRAITGQWIQPATVTSGSRFATPIVLTACGRDCFGGTVVPVDDEFTFYLRVTARPDGRLAAFLRNPERNLGRFIRADRIERSGERRTRTRRHGRGTAARWD